MRLCNSGVMAFRIGDLLGLLSRIGNENAKGEYYLTDAVEIARASGARSRGRQVRREDEVLGVNSREQLAAAEADLPEPRARQRHGGGRDADRAGDGLASAYDTKIGRDVTIEPNVFFGPGVTVEDGAEIKANCHIEGARIGQGARVGPFARLRPGADLGAEVHIGNFVEVKNATLEAGAKANHLAYVGDGAVGSRRQHRRRHHLLQLRRLQQAPHRRSARAPSSAPTPRWWHR